MKKNIIQTMAWLLLVTLVVMSLIKPPQTTIAIPNQDKWLHLSAYFFICYWFFHAYPNYSKHITFGLCLLGAVLELLQSQTSYRSMEWLDMLMNVVGVLMAFFTFVLAKIKLKFLLTT